MPITVNADDFGYSREVNEAICEAMRKGLINRTTLMTNMPAAEEAMEMATKQGFADRVGIHINLTSGAPLSEQMKKDEVMCDRDGNYTADFARNMRTRFFLPAGTRANVEREIRMQLDEYARLGGTLWHIDSHHHVHTDPAIWKILQKVIKDYPVSGVRLGRNLYHGGNPVMRFYKWILNASIRKYCTVLPDYFGSCADWNNWFGRTEEPEREKERFIRDTNIEIMVHPLYDADKNLMDGDEVFVPILNGTL